MFYLAIAIEERAAERGRPIFGVKLKGWRDKMFIVFTLYNLIWLLESKTIFFCDFLMPSPISINMHFDVRTVEFSRPRILID